MKEYFSKVLVIEAETSVLDSLKSFFEQNNLIGLKCHPSNTLEVLSSNIDLGAIFIGESNSTSKDRYLIETIHRARTELPIFLRLCDQQEDHVNTALSFNYSLNDLQHLKDIVEEHIFCRYYPSEFVRGLQDITIDCLQNTIKDSEVIVEPPFLVKDKFVYGELFSLIQLNSSWCRGNMMLQTTEEELLSLIQQGRTSLAARYADFRKANSLLKEVTNMIWGSIKSRFFTESLDNCQMQVPTIVHHKRKYCCFGGEEPQLCFSFVVSDSEKKFPDTVFHQKMIFNMQWSPEMFSENQASEDDFGNDGGLELF